jgi:hypothetical protein
MVEQVEKIEQAGALRPCPRLRQRGIMRRQRTHRPGQAEKPDGEFRGPRPLAGPGCGDFGGRKCQSRGAPEAHGFVPRIGGNANGAGRPATAAPTLQRHDLEQPHRLKEAEAPRLPEQSLDHSKTRVPARAGQRRSASGRPRNRAVSRVKPFNET